MTNPDSPLRVTVTVELPRIGSPVPAESARIVVTEPEIEQIPWYPNLDERVVVDISRYAYLYLIEAWKAYHKLRPLDKPAHFGQIYTQDAKGIFRNIITGEERP